MNENGCARLALKIILVMIGLYCFEFVIVLLVGWVAFPLAVVDELVLSPRWYVLPVVLAVVATVIAHGLLTF